MTTQTDRIPFTDEKARKLWIRIMEQLTPEQIAELSDADFAALAEYIHVVRYPRGCPLMCEACAKRVTEGKA